MKLITGLVLAAVLSGCAQYSVREMTDASGKPIGLNWHGFRQTGDFTSWQYSSVITDGSQVVTFGTDRGAGVLDPALGSAGAIGAGYFIGSGLKNAKGDVTDIDNINGQFQEQKIYNKTHEVKGLVR